jgi:hypothetical protein
MDALSSRWSRRPANAIRIVEKAVWPTQPPPTATTLCASEGKPLHGKAGLGLEKRPFNPETPQLAAVRTRNGGVHLRQGEEAWQLVENVKLPYPPKDDEA